jgi:hypothetical protein
VRQTGTVAEVRRWGIDERRFRLEVSNWRDDIAGPFRVVSTESVNGLRRVTITLDGDGRLNEVLAAIMAQGSAIHACDRIEPDLEEAFARLLAAESARVSA